MMENEEAGALPLFPSSTVATLAAQIEKALCNQTGSYNKAKFPVKAFKFFFFNESEIGLLINIPEQNCNCSILFAFSRKSNSNTDWFLYTIRRLGTRLLLPFAEGGTIKHIGIIAH